MRVVTGSGSLWRELRLGVGDRQKLPGRSFRRAGFGAAGLESGASP